MGLIAKQIMSSHVITVRPEDDLKTLAEVLVRYRISGAPVIDAEGRLLGVVSQSDLVAANKVPHVPRSVTLFDWVIYLEGTGRLQAELEKISASKVMDIMTREVITVPPDAPLERIATIMAERHVHTIPVMDGKQLVGVVGKLDIVRSILI